MKIKVIVFDFWQTLVSGSDKKIIDTMAKELHFKDAKEFWDYCDNNLFAYKIKLDDFLKNLVKKRNIDPTKFNRIKNLFDQSWVGVRLFEDTKPTLERLKGKFKLVLLSNTETTTGNRALDMFELRKYFDEIIFSCDVGLAKPNPKIFELVLRICNVKPEEILFIGDHLKNDIIPARLVGFKTILLDRRNKYPEYKGEKWYIKSLEELNL